MENSLVKRGFQISDIQNWREGIPLSKESGLSSLNRFKSGGRLKKTLIWLFYVLSLICSFDLLYAAGFLGQSINKPYLVSLWTLLIMLMNYLIIPITFLMWFYRINRNLTAFGERRRKYSSLFSILGFFIPIVFFFVPYLVAKNVIDLSVIEDSDSSRETKLDMYAMAQFWWSSYLLKNLIEFAMVYSKGDLFIFEPGWPLILYNISIITASLLTVQFIRMIDRLQSAKYNALQNHGL